MSWYSTAIGFVNQTALFSVYYEYFVTLVPINMQFGNSLTHSLTHSLKHTEHCGMSVEGRPTMWLMKQAKHRCMDFMVNHSDYTIYCATTSNNCKFTYGGRRLE